MVYFLVAIILTYITTENLPDCKPTQTIFLNTNGVHLDFIIPNELISDNLKKGLVLKSSSKYIAFGWGDKEFYLNTPTWGDLKFSTAFQAAFLKGESLLHLTEYNHRSNDWTAINLCDHQLSQLLSYINQSFKTNLQGEKISIDAHYGPNDQFYLAHGHYMFYKTCNSWVNSGLRRIGLKTPVWTPFDFGVLRNFQ